MVTRTRYLQTLCHSNAVDANRLTRFDTGLPGYTTANPVQAIELRGAVDQLKRHFGRRSPRPLNSMLLGGPGSGKTYLAKQLRDATLAEFREFNLSQFHHPSEILECFVQVGEWLKANPTGNILVLFDEFDVRVGSVAAIQFLIQPMYDGEIKVGGSILEFKRAAFLFSGSYLKERRVFDSIVSDDQLDLSRILFDIHHATPHTASAEPYRQDIWQKLLAVTAYDPVRQRLTVERDMIAYVRSLDKITDFASRINGFVLELSNLNTPLYATRNHYRIELESNDPASQCDSAAVTPDPQVAGQLIQLMDGLRRTPVANWFYDYPDPQQPVLEYKNLLLIDRLARTIDVLKRTHGHKGVRLSRALLHYLVTAPVVHGMRSLATIIESLVDDGGVLIEPAQRGVYERNVRRFEDYDNAEAVWSRMRRHNPVFSANPLLNRDAKEIVTVN